MKNHFRLVIVSTIVLSLSAVGMLGVQAGDPSPCPTSFSIVTPSMACVPPTPTPQTPTPEVVQAVNYEENVSFNDTDLGVALFKSEDANGDQQMDLYRVDSGTTNSTYLFSITQEDLAPYATEHPTVNTLLASADGVAVYVLTTGEIQVNAGPDAEGKIHVKIFNGIPWTHVYGYTIDPQ